MFKAVKQFREKMGLPISEVPKLLNSDEASYFARFIMEELSEYLRACEEQSIVGAADALADLVYVALGCAHAMGLPFEEIFAVVQRANMSKQPANEFLRSVRGKQYDVVKPENWQPPEPFIRELILLKAQHEYK